jgi:YHS domain-containing protein
MNKTTVPKGPARSAPTFDPVCGSTILDLEGANQFYDGGWTHHFCSAMCRRLFIDEMRARRAAETEREPWIH